MISRVETCGTERGEALHTLYLLPKAGSETGGYEPPRSDVESLGANGGGTRQQSPVMVVESASSMMCICCYFHMQCCVANLMVL